jgi:hypothetical protein
METRRRNSVEDGTFRGIPPTQNSLERYYFPLLPASIMFRAEPALAPTSPQAAHNISNDAIRPTTHPSMTAASLPHCFIISLLPLHPSHEGSDWLQIPLQTAPDSAQNSTTGAQRDGLRISSIERNNSIRNWQVASSTLALGSNISL